jgi:1,4-alpha-glucan branching enzyme
VDWDKEDEFRGIVRLYRDLIRLRLNRDGRTRGLCGQNVQLIRVDDANKMVIFRRWFEGGPGDDVVVVANFDRNPRENYEFGFPAAGAWKLHLNSDWGGYSAGFGSYPSGDVTATPGDFDGLPAHAPVNIGPYSVLVFSQPR